MSFGPLFLQLMAEEARIYNKGELLQPVLNHVLSLNREGNCNLFFGTIIDSKGSKQGGKYV